MTGPQSEQELAQYGGRQGMTRMETGEADSSSRESRDPRTGERASVRRARVLGERAKSLAQRAGGQGA